MAPHTSTTRAMRKTRSMAPAQLPFLAGRYQVTKRKAEVGPTWEGTFQSSVDSLELDKVDILMETRKRQRTRDHSFSGVDNNVSGPDNAVETDDAARLFRSMPAELHQLIAEHLPKDSDVVNYSGACLETKAAIDSRFWRRLFVQKYDFPKEYDGNKDPNGTDLFNSYKTRQEACHRFTIFDLKKHGRLLGGKDQIDEQKIRQRKFLDFLRTIILEMNSRQTDVWGLKGLQGRNLKLICDLVTDNGQGQYVDVIDSILSTDLPNVKVLSADHNGTLVIVLQLVLSALSLHPGMCNKAVRHFDISQMKTYALTKHQPIFTGPYLTNINALWLLYTVNFFKFHLKSPGEGIMEYAYSCMDDHQYPSMWSGRLQSGTQPLQRYWKGATTFMGIHDLVNLRINKGNGEKIYSDSLDSHDRVFQDMELFFDETDASKVWSTKSDVELRPEPWVNSPAPVSGKAMPKRRSTRSTPRVTTATSTLKQLQSAGSFVFYGVSHDSRRAFLYGRVHALPPQQGVHGFQRIVVQKFYLDDSANYPNGEYYYEGCVFPGGRIIVGRWWLAGEVFTEYGQASQTSGPFLWWGVDQSATTEPSNPEEILEFARVYNTTS